jgi:hypothetical protein
MPVNWKEIATAIALEAMFAVWCDHMYPVFSEGGDLNGMGTPRQVFRDRLAKNFGVAKALR